MVTVLRERGLHVRIHKDDHPPAHVHVVGNGEAKLAIAGPDGDPVLISAKGMNRSDIRRAFDLVKANAPFLLDQWRRIHG